MRSSTAKSDDAVAAAVAFVASDCALRGGYGGMLMFGMLGRMAGLAMLNPATIVLGVFMGRQAMKSEKDRALNQRRSQARQAKMQETATRASDQINSIDRDPSVPTLDEVRDKIERRYADALGAQELTQNAVNTQMSEITSSGTDMKANARLAEIRASMHADDKPEAITAEPEEKPAGKPEEKPAATSEDGSEKE